MNHPATVLTVAGSDPCGGAGLQADLKTLASLGVPCTAVVTAVTVQTAQHFESTNPVSESLLRQQLAAALEERPGVIKTGLLPNPPLLRIVAQTLAAYREDAGSPDRPIIVVDPILAPTASSTQAAPELLQAFRSQLLPLADLLTPNLPEASALLGLSPDTPQDPVDLCHALLALGPGAVLLKGGHGAETLLTDHWDDGANPTVLQGQRLPNKPNHGTGCVLSAAIAGLLALACPPLEAVRRARTLLQVAMEEGVDSPQALAWRLPSPLPDLWPLSPGT